MQWSRKETIISWIRAITVNPEVVVIIIIIVMNTIVRCYYGTGTVLGVYIVTSNLHNNSSKWLLSPFRR